MSSNYRPDIDGLRAVAVLAVILYHAGVPGFAGGFVGVDVFFVLSGFVITRSVRGDLARGTFSAAAFWERRVRRLFPSLYAVVLASLVVGWIVLLPDDLKRLGQSVVANALFLSNAYFLKDAGYFGVLPQLKPLLHTWSLSVEEQFYFLLPIAALVFRRRGGPRGRRLALWAAWGTSLALAIALTPLEPRASFFLLPTRAWELLSGALIAHELLPARVSPRSRPWSEAIGAALVLAPMALYHESSSFPGALALPPVAGTTLLLAAGEGSCSRLSRALASRPLVYVGRISYPLYLWHFPALAFGAYLVARPLSGRETAGLLVLAFVLSAASTALLESPVRSARILKSRAAIAAFAASCMALTVGVGLSLHLGRGFGARLDPTRRAIAAGLTDHERHPECMSGDVSRAFAACAWGPPSADAWIVWGDSHAEALLPGLRSLDGAGARRLVFAGHYGCPIDRLFEEETRETAACVRFGRDMLDRVERAEASTVVLASNWRSLGADPLVPVTTARDAGERLARLVERLRHAGKAVVIVGPPPRPYGDVPRVLFARSRGLASDLALERSRAQFDEDTSAARGAFERIASAHRPWVRVLDPGAALCASGTCVVEDGGAPLYSDDKHLTRRGAVFVATRLRVFDP